MSEYSANFDSTVPVGQKAGSHKAAGKTRRLWPLAAFGLLIAAGGAGLLARSAGAEHGTVIAAAPLPSVKVSPPLQQMIAPRNGFLGQFSAVDSVELRAQVGGTLTEIHFTDGQIVHKGDLLFVIDPRPYEIRLAQATAQVQSASARLALAGRELVRATNLKKDDFGTSQNVEQREAEQHAAQAALSQAMAAVRDAQLDLEFCRVTAPFTGRISAHRASIGSLISGSRAGSSPTTLLTTLVSLDPIHIDFDMSEAEYLAYEQARQNRAQHPQAADAVQIALGDETGFSHKGELDFIDNALDRSSGTIHARATVPNPDLSIAPGQFGRLRLTMGAAKPALLVPEASVALDQSSHVVMTVAPDGTVVPKPVEVGAMRNGLRVIRSGLTADDRVVIDGLMRAMPGSKVAPETGTIHAEADQG